LQGVAQYYYDIRKTETGSEAPDIQTSPSRLAKKVDHLIDILSKMSFHQCLIFSNDKTRAGWVGDKLEEAGWMCGQIRGGLLQQQRNSAIKMLRNFQLRILISTDLTARGIDLDRVNLVINLDLPKLNETYLHRIGRTGRFGTYGVAVTFVSSDKEVARMNEISEKFCTRIEPLPDEIPEELYVFELSDQDKLAKAQLQSRETKAKTNKTTNGNSYLSSRENHPHKREKVEFRTQLQHSSNSNHTSNLKDSQEHQTRFQSQLSQDQPNSIRSPQFNPDL